MNKIIKYLSEFNELELKEDFEEIVREFNIKDRQKNKPMFLEPVLIGNTIIGGGMFEDYKKEFKNRMKATNAEKDEVIRYCRENYVNRFLKDKTLDKIYNNLLVGGKDEEIMPITSDNLTKYGFYSQKHLMQEVIKFKNYLNDIDQKDFNNLTSDNANIIPQQTEPEPLKRKKPGRKRAVVKEAREYLKGFELDENKDKFLRELQNEYKGVSPKVFNHLIIALKKTERLKEASNKALKESFENAIKPENQNQSNFNATLSKDPDEQIINSIQQKIEEIINENALV